MKDFESILIKDCLSIIFEFVSPSLRTPLFFVNRRWKGVCFRLFQNDPDAPYHIANKLVESSASIDAENLVKWAVQNGCGIDGNSLFHSIKNGNLKLTKWIVSMLHRREGFKWGCNIVAECIRECGRRGDIESFKILYKIVKSKDHDKFYSLITFYPLDLACEGASECSKEEMIRSLMDEYSFTPSYYSFCIGAIKRGAKNPSEIHLDLGIRLKRNQFGEKDLCLVAAKYGRLELLKYLDEKSRPGIRLSHSVPEAAALGGHLDIIKWLVEDGMSLDYPGIVAAAAEGGHFQVLEFLYEIKKCPWSERTLNGAASNGRIDVLEWCIDRGCPSRHENARAAAQSGKLECFEWILKKQNLEMLEIYLYHSINGGNYQFSNWLLEKGCPIPKEACELAAANGDFQLLKLIYEKIKGRSDIDSFFNASTCSAAARTGQLRILKFLRENDAKWNTFTLIYAAGNGHSKVLKYAMENDCPCIDSDQVIRKALEGGRNELAKQLRSEFAKKEGNQCCTM